MSEKPIDWDELERKADVIIAANAKIELPKIAETCQMTKAQCDNTPVFVLHLDEHCDCEEWDPMTTCGPHFENLYTYGWYCEHCNHQYFLKALKDNFSNLLILDQR